ncbi:L,D-transpeptidase family protein [Qipengyuania sp. XHP0207]|uniref:L,D-transpeptidase family protein n=1 Tax=Qipengyuania sp. XHP0207 TaxID=3038078 RepID=UPI00241E4073|nr:L,D-transpeptidase family protein [Qipengyuania sp. XHP0207]MDG5748910.1 L,D-transpeptidase family protein [Qipengyuania sp. XHP0207]
MRGFLTFLLIAITAALAPASAQQARQGEVADFILIDKSDRMLWVYQGANVIRTYRGLQFGDQPLGHKQFEGDERTPEGRYTIAYGNPQSSYFLSLFIDYPNAADRAYAEARGRSPGGLIFIHGQPNGLPDDQRIAGDWTDGCIALSNSEIAELWSLVPDGTPIEIRP